MIIESIMSSIAAVVGSILGALPTYTLPSWYTDAQGVSGSLAGYAYSIGQYAGGLDAWLPVGVLEAALSAVIASAVCCIAVAAAQMIYRMVRG